MKFNIQYAFLKNHTLLINKLFNLKLKKMKKLLLILCVSFLWMANPSTSQAQVGYEKGHTYLDLGVGFPRYTIGNYWGGYGYNYYTLPYFRANFEIGFSDIFSGGAFGGYSHYGWKWAETAGKYNDRYTNWSAGGRFTFHIWNFLNNNLELGLGVEKLDIYASLMMGATIVTHSDVTPAKRTTTSSGRFFIGATVGGKYYFTNNLAIFLEGGYGSGSYGIIGVTFKF